MRVYIPNPCTLAELKKYVQEALGRGIRPKEMMECCTQLGSLERSQREYCQRESEEKKLRWVDI